VSRVALRLRLTLAFALVMAAVLALTGLFLYVRFRADLNSTIAGSLSSRSDAVAALVGRSRGPLDDALAGAGGDDDVAQVLDPRGAMLAGTPLARERPLLWAGSLARARRAAITADLAHLRGFDGPLRLRARPVDRAGAQVVVVVGTGLDDRNDSLRTLFALLVVGGVVALALASVAGYALAAAALRPVEAMRRRAAAIAPARTGQRLPVPPADDEIGRLGATLNDMLARLEAAFARERTFVADASHELRTPLSVLKAELELAVREGRSPQELRAALESAAEETDRLVRLAEDLLVIARLDEGRLPLRTEDVDAGDLLATVAARFDARAGAAGRAVRVSDGHGIVVRGDRARLEQALGNLVDNALRHGSGDVEIAARVGGRTVELHVADAGPGLAPDFIDHAFERFARADGARSRGGAGLGLAIVAAIATSHRGHARAANRPGGGADVWIELPGSAQSSPEPEESSSETAARTAPVDASTLTSLAPTSTLNTRRPR
jgi:two-component system, OmpR family, sensor kinase